MPHDPHAALLDALAQTAAALPGWRVVNRTGRLVRLVPRALEEVLPPIGRSKATAGPRWLTLDLWVQPEAARLGVFWTANLVTDRASRDAVLSALLRTGETTGFVYKGTRGPWNQVKTPSFSGETVSLRWWPKGEPPDIAAGQRDVAGRLESWSAALPTMAAAVRGALATAPGVPPSAGFVVGQ